MENLTDKQLEKLADGLKSKQIRISLGQGTVLADLLEYTQQLIKKGGSSSAHKLQAVIQNSSGKSEIKPNKETDNSKNIPLIFGGILVVSLAVIVGYLLGKKRKEKEFLD